jgi:hypothetical protein
MLERFARTRGSAIAGLGRRACGLLPMIALFGDIDCFQAERPPGVPTVAMRGALFHPTTGYRLVGRPFDAADERRYAEFAASLGVLLESLVSAGSGRT